MAREYVLKEFRGGVDLRIDYASELNPQQCEAAQAPPGPSLVLAGAGSGKTRTLIYRVAYLLEQGIPPERILLLTFTNKAAREMMRRVAELLGMELTALWGGTFHSIGARILRANAEFLGYRADYTILDREDAEDLIKACMGEEKDSRASSFLPKAPVLADVFSRAANERRSVHQILKRTHRHLESIHPEIERIGQRYQERKKTANVMDFDDLLTLWLRLMEEVPEARERYQMRFEWVLVDEYQDTNQLQSDLVDLIAKRHRNIMAVGDDSQSIYSWRGANYRNILEFPRRYPEARIYKIEVNYRSTPEIIAVANSAIAANTTQFAKQLVPARKQGMKPILIACEDAHQQAALICQRIGELAEEGISLSEIAVLYRSHFHALELQLEMSRRRIPFVITSGIRFFEQAHIKDVAAALKLIANPSDELAFKRLVLMLPGIGPKAAEKLWTAFSRAERVPPAASASDTSSNAEPPAATPATASALMAISSSVPNKGRVAWAQMAATLSQMETPPVLNKVGEMIRLFVEGFYEDYAEDEFANAPQRIEEVRELATFGDTFQGVVEFLTQLSLLNNLEAEAEQRRGGTDDNRVRLSTVHQSKGLEFQVVFVIMLGEGMFPSARSLEDSEAVEEERRLFYVAVTRARDELYLVYPLLRVTAGQGAALLVRSRFLAEIPGDLLEEWQLRPVAFHEGSMGLRDAPDQPASDEENEPF